MTDGARDEEPGRVDRGAPAAGVAGPGGAVAGPPAADVAGPGGAVAGPPAAIDADPDAASVDIGRRRFFRQLAADVFQATATVVGAAQAIQQTSIQAASTILDPDSAASSLGLAGPGGTAGSPESDTTAPRGFRTAFRMEDDRLILVDQRRLPGELVEMECRTAPDVAWAIREMVVRGAPAIGQAAAYGLALTARRVADVKPYARRATLHAAASALANARPTAINLRWAVDRMLARMELAGALADDGGLIADALRTEADAICFEATRDHGLLAEHGLALLPNPQDRPVRVLTHCNTGPLACGQMGTALGVVQAAVHAGREIHVYVDETRPYLQGARLTAWELEQAGVPYTLIADGAAGSLLATGRIDAVLVGADRVAANGDTANKIGTYPLAVLAARHGVPFYVCAPLSSVDPSTEDGAGIPIEERSPAEVLQLSGARIAPPDATAWNPAFDVTPAELISAIVTEEGAVRSPFGAALATVLEAKRARAAAPPPFAGFVSDAERSAAG